GTNADGSAPAVRYRTISQRRRDSYPSLQPCPIVPPGDASPSPRDRLARGGSVAGSSLQRGEASGLLAAWGFAAAGGVLLMAADAVDPGDPGAPPARWPAGAAGPLDGRRPRLLIFLHPRCPCSRASLGELAALLDRCGDRVAARAVVFRPRYGREGWFPPDLRTALGEISGLEV